MRVAVLLGGLSSEREVSLASGKGVADACRKLGYETIEIDVGYNVAEQLKEAKPDVAFNALHGTYGEDGCIQGLLEFLRIPYTHSGVRASAIAMHKPTTISLFKNIGIRAANGRVYDRASLIAEKNLPKPCVVKPAADGSSVNVFIIRENDNFFFTEENTPKTNEYLVEDFIEGREITVAVLDGKAMGICEIRPKHGFYDYKNKYTAGNTEYIVPAVLEPEIEKQALDWAAKAHNFLGCSGVSRSDFRLNTKGELFILEINTNPGMTPTSLVPKIAKLCGMSYEDVVRILIERARLDNA